MVKRERLFFFFFFFPAAGRKLPPEAPLLVLPARVEPVRISQEGSDVVLRFPYPTVTNSGSTLTNLTKVTVTREIQSIREGQGMPPPPPDAAARERDEKLFRGRAETVAELSARDLDAATAGADLVVRDPLIPLYREKRLGHVLLRYGVTATRDKKRVSDLSPITAIIPRVPPDRPLHVVPIVEESARLPRLVATASMLDGTTPAVVAGYAVYRRESTEEEFDDQPIGRRARRRRRTWTRRRARTSPTSTPSARPRSPRCRSSSGRRPIESPVSTKDVFPPPAPEGLLVLAEGSGTRLVWNPSSRADLAFYRVYRRDGESRERIADGLKDPLFFDAGASGRTYEVTAVDKAGNESPPGRAK